MRTGQTVPDKKTIVYSPSLSTTKPENQPNDKPNNTNSEPNKNDRK